MIPDWLQRLFWGHTREESEALAEREAYAREFHAALSEAKRRDECFVVHAPEIWGGYCETHQYPVDRGNTCEQGCAPVVLRLKKDSPEWTITRLTSEADRED